MASNLASAASLLQQFQTACSAEPTDFARCNALLSQLKRLFLGFSTFFPGSRSSPDAAAEAGITRETLEFAVLMSAKARDVDAFERHLTQVKTYYSDYKDLLPESQRKHMILGLNLVRLLAQNRIGDFHTELELISSAEHDNLYIRAATELELHLMEGSYHKIRGARHSVPAPEYLPFMDMLMETVRMQIADCCSKAYAEISAAEATRLLMLSSEAELRVFCGKNEGWKLVGNKVVFEKEVEESMSIPAHQLISETLHYAKEMERIV